MASRVAICLYDDHVDTLEPSELIRGKSLQKVNLTASSNPNVILYLKKTNTNIPDWVEIVKGFSDLKTEDAATASSGAILLMKVETRIMACCFGSTVANINKINVVNDFGLAAAFQRIKKRNVKFIESYSLSANPITNSRSSARPTFQDTFDVDNYLENITELGGRFYSKTKSIIIKGKEFFSTPTPSDLDEIYKLCRSLLKDYQLSIVNEVYKRLTATRKVKEKKLTDFLNEELCKKINKQSNEISIVDYEVLSDVGTYTFSPKGKNYEELTIQDFYEDLPRGHTATLAYLKIKKITVFNADSQEVDQWPFYKCLFCDLKINLGSYILYKGNWYEIQKRYLSDLQNYIQDYEIDSSNFLLPKWDGEEDESKYNIRAARIIKGQCWDKKLYTHPEYSYGIEFCDILTTSNIFHVKKSASSALNSHLLLQTSVSAYLLHFDNLFRDWIKNTSKSMFKKNIFLRRNNRFKTDDVSYVIVLLSNSSRKLSESLPFFSLLSFNIIIRKISRLGFPIKVCKC